MIRVDARRKLFFIMKYHSFVQLGNRYMNGYCMGMLSRQGSAVFNL
ncbi:hypothetical protein HMPREF9406_1432 [Clostridium sp. HGF2]|nr:hypothetical protein HMPREF9406_1432 [Clostridium sp. HGF2]EQJ59038.1 hypothetical protein QSI_1666 [Clostridioides difficile P28]